MPFTVDLRMCARCWRHIDEHCTECRSCPGEPFRVCCAAGSGPVSPTGWPTGMNASERLAALRGAPKTRTEWGTRWTAPDGVVTDRAWPHEDGERDAREHAARWPGHCEVIVRDVPAPGPWRPAPALPTNVAPAVSNTVAGGDSGN